MPKPEDMLKYDYSIATTDIDKLILKDLIEILKKIFVWNFNERLKMEKIVFIPIFYMKVY